MRNKAEMMKEQEDSNCKGREIFKRNENGRRRNWWEKQTENKENTNEQLPTRHEKKWG